MPMTVGGAGGAGVTGSGTVNQVPLWVNTTQLGNSVLRQVGSAIVVGVTDPNAASLQTFRTVGGIVSKGIAARTLVLGDGVAENAASAATDSQFIGDAISGPGGTTTQRMTVIGAGIAMLAAHESTDRTIHIGGFPTFGKAIGQYGTSVHIGVDLVINPGGASTDTFGSVLVGYGATVRGGNAVGIGALADVGGESVAIGHTITGGGTQSAGLGKGVNLDSNSVALGRRARTGPNSVSLGFYADTLARDSSGAFGRDSAPGFDASWAFGRGSVCFGTNEFSLGNGPIPYDMRTLRLGPNTEAGYVGLTIALPSATGGVDIAAPNTTIRAGTSTGASVTGGRIAFQSGTQGASGGVYQTMADRLRIAPGGVAGIPTIEFVNQISTPGALTATLTNAPVAGNPTIWAEVLYNGLLRYIPMW